MLAMTQISVDKLLNVTNQGVDLQSISLIPNMLEWDSEFVQIRLNIHILHGGSRPDL